MSGVLRAIQLGLLLPELIAGQLAMKAHAEIQLGAGGDSVMIRDVGHIMMLLAVMQQRTHGKEITALG